MKLYQERLAQLDASNIPINTKQIRKALLNVLRQHSDVVSDGENTSSAGSDQAPSDDNLQLEEIAEVIPIMEDPQAVVMIKKLQIEQPDLPIPGTKDYKKKKAALDPNKKDKKAKKPKKTDLDSANASDEEKKEEEEVKPEEKPIDMNDASDTVHKKKLKKNVESRDA
jgi:outer membrane biosynthesis protein TonB